MYTFLQVNSDNPVWPRLDGRSMPYVFDTSERTTASGNAAETKALLHLLSFDEDCDKVDAFAIDCF